MCGLTGWVSFERDLGRHRATIESMTSTMTLRGPDSGGIWIMPHAALGHRRLAVIDPPGGLQPMVRQTSRGPVGLVYSGEVYNFVELRNELAQRGHRFHTHSDTEVVLHAYVEWGYRIAERLNGMFAFAVWDQRDETLLLVRDRMGIKPLYYSPLPDGVLFGSEPKAILTNPLAPRVVDVDGLAELFPETRSPGRPLWKGMREVQPGTVVTVERGGVRSRTYWSLPTRDHTDDLGTTVETVRDLLSDSIARQLVADVPQCILLSGGLDSSSIAGLASKHLAERDRRARTFALDFTGQSETFEASSVHLTRDAPYARAVAAMNDTIHSEVMLTIDDITDPDVRRTVVAARDMPGIGQLDASLYQLFKEVRSESTVALSGESADELFGGYPWFFDRSTRATGIFPWLAWQLEEQTSAGSVELMLRPERFAQLRIGERARDRYTAAVERVDHLDGATDAERRMRTVAYLALTQFVRNWLDRKDRMSMATGLEVRVPFCDHRLVEYVYNVPWSLKSFDGREKSLLRHATMDLLPPSVVTRTKSGYPATMDPRYGAALQSQAKDILTERDNPVFALIDRAWLDDAVQRNLDHAPQNTVGGLSLALDLYHWFDLYEPALELDG